MASDSRPVFNPAKHKIIFGGIDVSTRIANGVYLSIKSNESNANSLVGAGGTIITNLVVGNTAVAELKIMYGTPELALMRAASVAFKTLGAFLPFVSVNIDDPLDTNFSANSYIQKQCDDIYSMETSDMTRTFEIFLHDRITV